MGIPARIPAISYVGSLTRIPAIISARNDGDKRNYDDADYADDVDHGMKPTRNL